MSNKISNLKAQNAKQLFYPIVFELSSVILSFPLKALRCFCVIIFSCEVNSRNMQMELSR